jgi:hypothetical protein
MEKSQASVDNRLLGLLGLYQRHAIGTFNTCSQWPTHRSLIDTSGSYSLGGADLLRTTLRPSQPAVSTFHLRAPPGLQLKHIPPIKPKLSFKEPMAAMWSFDHLTIYRNLPLRLAISNDISLIIGFTRIDQKVTLM